MKLAKNLRRKKLCELDISHSSGITGKLCTLISLEFPNLNVLILNDCQLDSNDMQSLALANVQGRLPMLRHLM